MQIPVLHAGSVLPLLDGSAVRRPPSPPHHDDADADAADGHAAGGDAVVEAGGDAAAEVAGAAAAHSGGGARRLSDGIPQVEVDLSRRLRRGLTAAFFLNAAQRQPSGEYLALVSREAVSIHPSSVLFQRKVRCVLFNELLFTNRLYMRDLTQIEAEWLPELAPQFFAADATALVPGARPVTRPGSARPI